MEKSKRVDTGKNLAIKSMVPLRHQKMSPNRRTPFKMPFNPISYNLHQFIGKELKMS
jgi:hypothetical protein